MILTRRLLRRRDLYPVRRRQRRRIEGRITLTGTVPLTRKTQP